MSKVSYLHGSAKKTRSVIAEHRAREIFQAVSSVIGPGPDVAGEIFALILVNRENGRTTVLDFFRSRDEIEEYAGVYNDAIRNVNAPYPWFIKMSRIKVAVK